MFHIRDACVTTGGRAVGTGSIRIDTEAPEAFQLPRHDRLSLDFEPYGVRLCPYSGERDPITGFFPHEYSEFSVFISGHLKEFIRDHAKVGSETSKTAGLKIIEIASNEPRGGVVQTPVQRNPEDRTRGRISHDLSDVRIKYFCDGDHLKFELHGIARPELWGTDGELSPDRPENGRVHIRISLHKATCWMLFGGYVRYENDTRLVTFERDMRPIYRVFGSSLKWVPGQLNIENVLAGNSGSSEDFYALNPGVTITQEIDGSRPKIPSRGQFFACCFASSREQGLQLTPGILVRDEDTGFFEFKSEDSDLTKYGGKIRIYCLTQQLIENSLANARHFRLQIEKNDCYPHGLGSHELVTGYLAGDNGSSLRRSVLSLKVDGQLNQCGLILKITAALSSVEKQGSYSKGPEGPLIWSRVIIINWETLIVKKFRVMHHFSEAMTDPPGNLGGGFLAKVLSVIR